MTDIEKSAALIGKQVSALYEESQRLRQMWDAGIASGSAGEVDMEKLRREARARLKGAMKVAG
jgi:hypothetical protein